MKKNIVFIVVLMMMLMIPVSVYAAPAGISVDPVTFEYDGNIKSLELNNAQNITPESITWKVIPNGQTEYSATGPSVEIGSDAIKGDYSVTYGSSGAVLSGNYQIAPRQITIKPADVIEEFSRQTIKAKNVVFESGSLVNGHSLSVTFSGINRQVGEKSSSISAYAIKDSASNYVTDNYQVLTKTGRLILNEPFKVDVDPEQKGQLAGGGMSYPPAPVTPSNNSSNGGSASNTDSVASNNADVNSNNGATNNATIDDGPVPLDSGIDLPSDNRTPFGNEANLTLGMALFFAVFMIIAIIVIYLVARHRNKTRNSY